MNIYEYGALIKTMTLKERAELNRKLQEEKRLKNEIKNKKDNEKER